jgi:hypothetical protein
MPRKASLVTDNEKHDIVVVYSVLKPGTYSATIGETLAKKVQNGFSRKLSYTVYPFEERLTNGLTSMSPVDRAHLIPVLNVIVKGQLAIADGKVVPVGDRKAITKQQFLMVRSTDRSCILLLLHMYSWPVCPECQGSVECKS